MLSDSAVQLVNHSPNIDKATLVLLETPAYLVNHGDKHDSEDEGQ